MAQRSLANAKNAFEAVPAGWYPGIVDQCQVVEAGPGAKYPGEPQFKVQVTVREGDFVNRKFFSYYGLNEEIPGSSMTKPFLKAWGYDPDAFDDEEVAAEITGQECYVRVSNVPGTNYTTKEPERQNRVTAWSKEDPGEPTPTKADAEQGESEKDPRPVKKAPPAAKPAAKTPAKAPAKAASKKK